MISKCSTVLPTPMLWARAVQIIRQLSHRIDDGWPAFILALLQLNFSSSHLGYVNLISPCHFCFFLSLLRFHFLATILLQKQKHHQPLLQSSPFRLKENNSSE
ncbi:hypothetical protein CI102_5552 [Trichoderma harzianum]|nr:hypothetical protein CI102_5552 [Trichoderma harzianum]